MKKKFLFLILAMTLSIASLAGCSGSNGKDEENHTKTEASDAGNAEAKKEKNDGNNTTISSPPPVTAVEATLEKPAQLNEWVEITDYSAQDGMYHTVYFRVTDIIRGEEAQAIVNAYNAEEHVTYFEDLEDEKLEFCVFTYEVLFPEDFPQAEYGIATCSLNNLGICNLKDSGAIANYIGLSTAYDISTEPDEFFAGQTFVDGKGVFAMAKDFDEYLINCTYYDNNNESHTAYIRGK